MNTQPSTLPNTRRVLTIDETAQVLASGRSTIYNLINANRLEALKIGRKTVITTASVEAFLAGAPRIGREGNAA